MPCKPENKSYVDSYEVTLDSVKRENPSLPEREAKVQAALLFRPYFRRIAETARIEASGDEQYANGEFTLTSDGKMYYPKENQTAEQLHLNQLRLSELHHNPNEYSFSDHQTTLLLEHAFQSGATRVITSYGNRDVLEYRYDPVTKKGTVWVHNTATDKHDHPSNTMQKIVREKFSGLHETKITNNVFVLSDTPLDESKVRQTGTHVEQHVGYAMKATVIMAGTDTLLEMKQTRASIEGYLRRKQDKQQKDISVVVGDSLTRRVRRMFEHHTDVKEKAVVPLHPKEKIKTVELEGLKKHDINLPGHSLERVKQVRRYAQGKIASSAATLLFVRETGVGAGGVFESLQTIIRSPNVLAESVKQTKKEKTTRRRHNEMTLKRKRILKKMRVFPMSESFKKLATIEQRVLRRKEKAFRAKEKKLLRRKEQRSMRRKEKLLWTTLKRLVQKERQFVSMEIKRKKKLEKIHAVKKEKQTATTLTERHTKRQEKQHVTDFSVTLVIWLLLHMPISSHPLKEKKHVMRLMKRQKSEKLMVKEPTPWLLFAIIWHLAVIRESRLAGHGKKKKKTVQKQKIYWRAMLPPTAVIFAFAS